MKVIRNKPVIFMHVDSPRRDLEWRVKMAVHFSKFGAVSIIGQKEYIIPVHHHSKNAIWFGRFMANDSKSTGDDELRKSMRANGTQVHFIHDEGAFFNKAGFESRVLGIHPPEILEQEIIESVFVWGEEQKNIIIKNNSKLEDKIQVTGYPRFDLYREKNHEKKENDILVCSKFGTANPGIHALPPFSERLIELFQSSADQYGIKANDFAYERWKKDTLEHIEFCEITRELAEKNPELKIIYRPHPDEDPTKYEYIFKYFKNIFVSQEGDVQYAIKKSKVVLQSDCTTGLESLLLRTPTVNYQPLGVTDFSVKGLSDIGILANDRKEAIQQLLKCIHSKNETTEIKGGKSIHINNGYKLIIKKIKSKIKSSKVTLPQTNANKNPDTNGKQQSYRTFDLQEIIKNENSIENLDAKIIEHGSNFIVIG